MTDFCAKGCDCSCCYGYPGGDCHCFGYPCNCGGGPTEHGKSETDGCRGLAECTCEPTPAEKLRREAAAEIDAAIIKRRPGLRPEWII